MADFDFILQANTTLFKGCKKKCTNVEKSHMWVSDSKEVAQSYGNHLHTFKTLNDIKLIFTDFVGKLNLLYRNNRGKDVRKSLALMPLGLPSWKEAKRTLETLNIDTFLNFNFDTLYKANFVTVETLLAFASLCKDGFTLPTPCHSATVRC